MCWVFEDCGVVDFVEMESLLVEQLWSELWQIFIVIDFVVMCVYFCFQCYFGFSFECFIGDLFQIRFEFMEIVSLFKLYRNCKEFLLVILLFWCWF